MILADVAGVGVYWKSYQKAVRRVLQRESDLVVSAASLADSKDDPNVDPGEFK